MADVVRVCVTGAAGQIAYSLLYNLARGDLFGLTRPIVLQLLDITPMLDALRGVVMELDDCALPLLRGVVATDDPEVAFKDVDVAILVGAMPRRQGMERKDLLKANAKIFKVQGEALDKVAKRTVKVLVVGNPANTNGLIAMRSAPSLPPTAFTALTRLDLNRAQSLIARRLNVSPEEVKNIVLWGNHSSTQFPDVAHATCRGESVEKRINDEAWLHGDFIRTVQTRGAAVIEARKLSSAMSAAKAIIDHVHDWIQGTPSGEWVAMAVASDGSYGIPEGLLYSMPVTCANGTYKIVQGLPVSEFARAKMDETAKELLEEREQALELLASL